MLSTLWSSCPLWSAKQIKQLNIFFHTSISAITNFVLNYFFFFRKHRFHNEDVNNFWNEIELMYNNKEKQRLESERAMRTKRCHVNISSNTQDMMENMAEETVEAHLATTKKRSTRKRKSICYRRTECSEEEDHSSDPDYMEKPRRKQESRSKRLREKANCDTLEKSSPAQSTVTSNTSEDFATSRESTPCPIIQRESTSCLTIHSATSTLIATPNKLQATYDESDTSSSEIDLIKFEAYSKLDQNCMWTLESSRKVEEVIYEFARNLPVESNLHSFIINDADASAKSLFSDVEWKEITSSEVKESPKLELSLRDLMLKYTVKSVKELRKII